MEHATLGELVNSTRIKPISPTINAVATAFMFLDVPWYELLWFAHFREELAQSMAYAWTRGVASLLSDLSGVPDDRIVKDTYEIDFHEKLTATPSHINVNGDGKHPSNRESEDTHSIPLTTIFEKKMIDLYQSAKENLRSEACALTDKDGTSRSVEVRLKVIPYDMEFISLYSIPYLSRENSARDPHLLTFYKKMLGKSSADRATDLNKLRRQYLDRGRMESTVIAQCLVWCREIFYVKDLGTGQILQGKYHDPSTGDHEDLAQIPHLVRMEKTVITESDMITGALRNIQGDWIITDIDDLLGGNLVA